MEKNGNQASPEDKNKNDNNANSTYSGSGSMQPGGTMGQAGQLRDFPDGEIDEVKNQTDTIPGKHTEQPIGKTVDEATDPSKLTDH